MGAAWRDAPQGKEFDRVLEMVRGVRALGMEACCTLGMLTDEQAEAVPDKPRLGIPSLNLFGSRNAPGAQPSEGHLDFSPMIPPRGEELIALADVTGKIYADLGLTPPADWA